MCVQSIQYVRISVCTLEYLAELVLNVLGKVWFIWSGRRSGELRPVRYLVFSGMI